MSINIKFFVSVISLSVLATSCIQSNRHKIDRYALVNRHNINVTKFDSMASLSVGNGSFAFTVDPTGLQTFPSYYENGVSLGTESDWGWHSFPNSNNYTLTDVTKNYSVHGEDVPYVRTFKAPKRKEKASAWLRQNPHRLDLGRISWEIHKSNNTPATQNDIKNIQQKLNLWRGEVLSHFNVDNKVVNVKTLCSPQKDLVAVHAASSLFKEGKMRVKIHFSYGSGDWENACDWNNPDKHSTIVLDSGNHRLLLQRVLDTTVYYVQVRWKGSAQINRLRKHEFEVVPGKEDSLFSFTCQFSSKQPQNKSITFAEVESKNKSAWEHFWRSGGAVDLSGSTDPRAEELERRIVLSQYLCRIQDAGIYPPQETGLTYNSWYGKFHLEMYFWHESHFALWDHTNLLKKSFPFYQKIAWRARKTAQQQGYEGLRWPKMTDPSGRESPSPIGPFLIWQEPHIIYLLELCYRNNPDESFLEEYKNLVFGTAKFMASYAWENPSSHKYILGPALIPAQEQYSPDSTINPTFELAYWYWGLSIAQQWRKRLGLEPNQKWEKVMKNLSPLPVKNGLYLAAESVPDTYTNPEYTSDHPSMLMAYGFLPKSPMVDTATMRSTLKKIMKVWNWDDTWGWDYPTVAMSATRLGMPKTAINALMMPVTKNTYLPNGHNYQRDNLRCYLPGNGSLLTAVALMCAGWDGYEGPPNPGFPRNGQWKVKWENLNRMP